VLKEIDDKSPGLSDASAASFTSDDVIPLGSISGISDLETEDVKAEVQSLRQQAQNSGEELQRLQGDLYLAETEEKYRDAFLLKMDIKQVEGKMHKLHKRAARLLFQGEYNALCVQKKKIR
jgi:hypothetical protein